MNQSVWTRLDVAARSLAPFAVTLFLVIVAMVPFKVPGISAIVPSLGLISVYFWVIYRPDLMPVWAVFLVGVIQDLLSGGQLGAGTMVLLLIWFAIAAQRRFFSSGSFMVIWAVFILLAAGAQALIWLFNSVIVGMPLDARPLVFQYLTTV
ncbi:MAG TPA: rod shape-determining protein MreD, partial [Kiloniellales bacterium]